MRREALGNFAEKFADKHVIGDKSNADYMQMLEYYPENDAEDFKNVWCCTFIYHCCRAAGFDLPLGTHQTIHGRFRWFTGCITWFEWAKTNGFIHEESADFVPMHGDIVIYNNIIPEKYKQKNSLWCDHMGIVLSCNDNTLTVAEGNVDNQNVSGIVNRKRNEMIGCYIRIPEDYICDEYIEIPKNVYFIWGNGKKTAARELARHFNCFIYHADDSHSLQTTPLIITKITEIAAHHKIVICVGNIDADLIAPLTTHAVYIKSEKQMPREVTILGVKAIMRNKNTTFEQIAKEIAKYFRFKHLYSAPKTPAAQQCWPV